MNPVEYLGDVLARIDKSPASAIAELLPDRWKPPPKPTHVLEFDE